MLKPSVEHQQLLNDINNGSEQAFKSLYNIFSDKVFNTCLSILQHQPDAEDTTQEVFVEVFRSVKHFKGDSSLQTWIYRIAVTKSLDHLKKKKAGKRFAFIQSIFGENDELHIDKPHFDHPGVLLENKEHARVLFYALSKLADKQKTAFTLHKLEGLPYAEVADIMQTSISAVESLIFRANENLKSLLSEYYKKNIAGGASSLLSFLLM